MKRTRAFVFLAAIGLIAAAPPDADDAAGIKGDWTIASLTLGGKTAPSDMFKDFVSTFDGQSYTNKVAGQVVESGDYKVDASKSPKTIDFDIKKGPEAGKKQLGLYQLVGDTMTLCVSDSGLDKRPATFEPGDEATVTVIVLKRVKR